MPNVGAKSEKNEDNVNYNIINNKPTDRRLSSSILKSPKKEAFDLLEKKYLLEINSIIREYFKNKDAQDLIDSKLNFNYKISSKVRRIKLNFLLNNSNFYILIRIKL